MKVQSEADFDALFRGAKLLAVASAWSELGLWAELARHHVPVDLGDLPGDPRALSISAAILAHAGLLESDGDGRQVMLSASARELYSKGQLPPAHTLELLADLTQIVTILKQGGPAHTRDGRPKLSSGGVYRDDPARTRAFLDMLHRRSEQAAETTADWLLTRIPAGAHVLDIGGGHGRYSEVLVQRGCRATLFDLPLVVELARERHGERLSYIAGDFHVDSFGGPYDAALLSNIVHGESDATNQSLLRRVFDALAPGGHVVLKDMFIDDQGRDPENAIFFGAMMLFYTAQGQSYRVDDVRAWCAGAGFEPPRWVTTDGFSLIFARKPAG